MGNKPKLKLYIQIIFDKLLQKKVNSILDKMTIRHFEDTKNRIRFSLESSYFDSNMQYSRKLTLENYKYIIENWSSGNKNNVNIQMVKIYYICKIIIGLIRIGEMGLVIVGVILYQKGLKMYLWGYAPLTIILFLVTGFTINAAHDFLRFTSSDPYDQNYGYWSKSQSKFNFQKKYFEGIDTKDITNTYFDAIISEYKISHEIKEIAKQLKHDGYSGSIKELLQTSTKLANN